MFKFLLKGLQAGIGIKLLDHYRRLSIDLFRIESAKCYLRGVQLARMSAIGLIGMGLVIGLICLGMLLFHGGLFILLPWTLKAKAVLAMGMGLGYTIGGGIALYLAMDEKRWLEKSVELRVQL